VSSERDYPYNPDADVTKLVGLAKLTAIQDRSLAAMLHELYFVAERNERDPRFQARERAKEQRRLEEERDHLEALANSARSGALGKAAEELCHTVGHGNDMGTLRHLAGELRTISDAGRIVRRG
jgi:hypothetical protein